MNVVQRPTGVTKVFFTSQREIDREGAKISFSFLHFSHIQRHYNEKPQTGEKNKQNKK